jgi:hypothetical protein
MAGARDFSLPDLGLTQLSIQWVPGAISPRVKRPGHEAPSGAKVKNGGAIPLLPHTSSWLGA